MKRLIRILITLFMLAQPVVSAGVSAGSASAAPVYTCFPTCSPTDGRFLGLAGKGLNTLAGDSIKIEIAVPAGRTTVELGIFDGETGGDWDFGTTPFQYTLYADPLDDGTGSVMVNQWLGTSMPDNAWFTANIPTTAAAVAPSGNYFYHLDVTNTDLTQASENDFKVRADASVTLQPQAFAYIGAMMSTGDYNIIYPNYPDLTSTTYDGSWDTYLAVPLPDTSFAVWDGDLDFGKYDCSINDTDDLDTPNAPFLPAWAAGTGAVPEGVAHSSLKCVNATGTGFATGNPADDSKDPLYSRSPSINYSVILPDGTTYQNTNPSGNTEWEQFKISSNAADVPANADYSHNGPLPAGTYHIQMSGVDLHNLNAWRFNYAVLGVCDDGTPCVPVPKLYLVGDTIWYDTNGNGVQDSGEPGIANVKVNLVSNGQVIGTTVTDANGKYSFSVDAGTYIVQIDASNFAAGGTLAGFASTTGGDSQTNTVVNANILTYDFGYKGNSSIGDRVWFDANANGLQTSGPVGVGEVGVAGVTVNLLDGNGNSFFGMTTTTDANGNYLFSNLPSGSYIVQFTAPTNTAFTTYKVGSNDAVDSDANPTTGKTAVITLATSQNNLNVDAGLIQNIAWSCPTNLVLNPSFELNTGSPPTDWHYGTAGKINVPAVDGKNVAYISGRGTMYQNVNVTPGNSYTLTFYSGSHNPYKQTVKLQYFNASNVALGPASVHYITSDLEVSGFGGPYTLTLGAAPTNAKYLRIMVSANGYDYAKVDALCLQPTSSPATGSIGDFVWKDANGNGLQDSGEAGLPGFTVKLLDSGGNAISGMTTTTDSNGKYLFSNLAAGTYYVQFVASSGYTFTTANAGSDDTKDSDASVTNGKTGAVNLTVGQSDLTMDAGFKTTSTGGCALNLVLNWSFEANTGTPPTYWTNGTAGPINVPAVDGKNVGYISGSGTMYQNINVTVGSSYVFTFYSGSHNPYKQTVKIQYYDASNVTIGTAAVHTITTDLEVAGGFGGPYTLTLGAAPSNAKYLRISVSANGYDYAKVDALCLVTQ